MGANLLREQGDRPRLTYHYTMPGTVRRIASTSDLEMLSAVLRKSKSESLLNEYASLVGDAPGAS